jgi:hypothetical protein
VNWITVHKSDSQYLLFTATQVSSRASDMRAYSSASIGGQSTIIGSSVNWKDDHTEQLTGQGNPHLDFEGYLGNIS